MNNSPVQNSFSSQLIKNASLNELKTYAEEIREMILDVLSTNGGHLASNLGIVELTLALHKVFDSPSDQFIFDTSHQTYTHKILTQREQPFETLRKYLGLSGFANPDESVHDHYFGGHAGVALSHALGAAENRDLQGKNSHVIPILGDGSLTCGMIFEALNNIKRDLKNFIIVLNDNEMAISKNVGNISNVLSRLLNNPTSNKLYQEIQVALSKIPAYGKAIATQGEKIKSSIKNLVSPAPFFEHFGLDYIGPIDGHNLKQLTDTFTALKHCTRPVLVHVNTQKGKGLLAAVENPTPYHGVAPFNKIDGSFQKSSKITFPKIFGKHLMELGKQDPTLQVITPAMMSGSCITEFYQKYPQRVHDVGIAENHCVAFAGAAAKEGKHKWIISIYSTFLQRAFDNVFHDVCLQRSPVIFAIDRAGISAADGATHHGIYDLGFLLAMPHLIVAQPRNGQLLKELFSSAMPLNAPIAIRYPNMATNLDDLPLKHREVGKAEIIQKGQKLCIIALGHMYLTALEVSKKLEEKGITPTIVDPVFLAPFDNAMLENICKNHTHIVTLEEHSVNFGLGTIVNSYMIQSEYSSIKVRNFGIGKTFLPHGDYPTIMKLLKLDANSLYKEIISWI
ncbi:MAG TPA: 1-deoxy-D-xylulose-5-phosphate synthase [Chlamydiales bacterium]|nr:1-deoxy-D-xylulose-5-phosphate synthase [Chlamydiales bacterium]